MKSIEQVNLKNKYIVINGGFGLIGSKIAEKCLLSGAQILIVDNNKKKLSLINKKLFIILYYEMKYYSLILVVI